MSNENNDIDDMDDVDDDGFDLEATLEENTTIYHGLKTEMNGDTIGAAAILLATSFDHGVQVLAGALGELVDTISESIATRKELEDKVTDMLSKTASSLVADKPRTVKGG